MARKAESVLVVGGGVIGVATAYQLVLRGYRTTLLEARDGMGLETSFANGAMLTPSLSEPWNAPGIQHELLASLFKRRSVLKLRYSAIPSLALWGVRFLRNSTEARYLAAARASFILGKYSVDRTRQLRSELSLHYDAAAFGTLKMFRAPALMEAALRVAEHLRPLGLRYEVLNGDAAVAVEPNLGEIRSQISGALRFPDDEAGDAHKFCQELATAFVRAGGAIRTMTRVTAVAVERGRVAGIESAAGRITADMVIIAAGNSAGRLLRNLRLSVPVKPVKGYSVTFDASHLERGPSVPVVDDALHAAVVPVGTRLRVVGGAEFAGTDLHVRPEGIADLIDLFTSLYPKVRASLDIETSRAWAGLRAISADGLPFVGGTSVRGLYLNVGHGHLGWTFAVGCAHLLADLLADAPTEIDSAPYSPLRLLSPCA